MDRGDRLYWVEDITSVTYEEIEKPKPIPRNKMKDFAQGVEIISKYIPDSGNYMDAYDSIIFFGEAEWVSEEDKNKLFKLGWIILDDSHTNEGGLAFPA